MGEGTAAVIVGALTLIGTYITVRYKDYWANRAQRKDRLEIFLERYDKDIESLYKRLSTAEKKLDEALKLLDEKEHRINVLERKLAQEAMKYTRLLRRFNTLKAKYEHMERTEKARRGVK